LFQGDIQKKAPFESGYFDILICEQVLEHLNSPSAALDEIARVLKPGGFLVLGVPTFPWGISHLRKVYVFVTMKWFGIHRAHVQTFDLPSIKRLVRQKFDILDSYGFRIISGGLVSPLEDFSWWYKFNRWLGRTVTFACTEVQILAIRKT
jgi:SAM-dependent methyltransferase